MTHYEQSLEWATEWFKANRPELEMTCSNEWADEFSEFILKVGVFEMPYFEKWSPEIALTPIFKFPVPERKEDFFTLLNILTI